METEIGQTGRINWGGYWYEYKYMLARHQLDICLATTDPDKFCNGTYLYSKKDPGNGLAFVVVNTNDPMVAVMKSKIRI